MTSDQQEHQPVVAARRVFEGENPFGLDPHVDFLQVPDHDSPLWSETMYFAAWSPEDGVGFWAHCGVVLEDKSLWWSQVYALLPDGVVLVDRSFGRPADNRGPDTGNLRIRCEEPLERWSVSFDGAGEVTSTDQLTKALAGAGLAEPFRFDVTFKAIAPVFDLNGAIGDSNWSMGGSHQNQGFRTSGTLSALGSSWVIDGVGSRDHTVGEREFSDHGGHVYNSAVWPQSGRTMSMASMWRRDAPWADFTIAMVSDYTRTEISGDFELTGTSAYGGHPRELELKLIRADGSRLDLRGEVVHNWTMSYIDPNQNLNGAALDPSFQDRDPSIADESIVRWYWPDGEVGYGYVERGFRPSALPSPKIPLQPGSAFLADREQ